MLTFIGDPHGDFTFALKVAQDQNPEALILLGDQCPEVPLDQILAPFPCPVFYILGNHDSDRPHWLENHFPAWGQNIGGTVADFAGKRIAALPGVFRGKIWMPEREPVWKNRKDFLDNMRGGNFKKWLPIKHWTTIFPEDFENLVDQGPTDVLVAHEAPSCHRHGFQVIDRLAENLEVDLIVHGHHHENYTARLENGIKVVGLSRLGSFSVEAKELGRELVEGSAKRD